MSGSSSLSVICHLYNKNLRSNINQFGRLFDSINGVTLYLPIINLLLRLKNVLYNIITILEWIQSMKRGCDPNNGPIHCSDFTFILTYMTSAPARIGRRHKMEGRASRR